MSEIQKQEPNGIGTHMERLFEGHTIRVQQDDAGDPWFCAKDVCDAIGHTDASVATSRLDADERGTRIVRTPSGDQEMLHVSEPGLYSLVGKSRKVAAKRFDRWVRHEVLPAIRKTGGYTATAPEPTPVLAIAPANDSPRVVFDIVHTLLLRAGVSEGMAAASVLADAEAHFGVRFDGSRKALPILEKPRADLNATALGALLEISAIEANRRLAARGLQAKSVNGDWQLTETGRSHGEAHEFKRHLANGAIRAGMQILWFASAAELIREKA